MKELTKSEEQIMQILWDIKQGFVKDMISFFPEPKPAYNTVSTIVRILEEKGFIDHKAYGKTHEYFPIISKREYTKKFFSRVMSGYFSNSYKQLASFFTEENDLSVKELEEIKELMNEEIKKQKSIKK